MQKILSATLVIVAVTGLGAQRTKVPTYEQIIDLKRPGATAISPDGGMVAFTVTETNWEENAYETEIYLSDGNTPNPIQLTRAKKSSTSPAWSPDGAWIAFISDRSDKRQIYLISPKGGEATVITNVEEGVSAFEWSPDGKQIAFTMTDPLPDVRKERDKKFGAFEVVDQDWRMTHLHVIEVDPDAATPAKARRLTNGAITVGSFDWSPDSASIAFDHRVDPNPPNGDTADISVLSVKNGAVRKVVSRPGPDSGPVWSPDGSQLAFLTNRSDPYRSFMNSRVAIVSARGGEPRNVTDAIDEQPGLIEWGPAGLYVGALEGFSARLYLVSPDGKVSQISLPAEVTPGGVSLSRDFSRIAYTLGDARRFPEVHVGPLGSEARQLTDFGAQIRDLQVGNRETIKWKSTDGTEITGVLHKPADFQEGRKYPLLVIVHGGPTAISRPSRVAGAGPYPIEQWLAKGAIILEPNYRGSAGFGEKFRSLNYRNLGVGDAWDVLSGVDHLVKQGLADPDRMGVMGWSQGGYISAFLATHQRQPFKAISVGAGISNWMTYYVNTDIHQFTRHYLGATPWDDPAIYAKTSPMTTIKQAKTPTLIQHGEFDTRVPTPNAYELYQGLQDVGVPVKLIIYKGFGHGLNKPKAARAAMEHNFDWFNRYVWGEKPMTTSDASR